MARTAKRSLADEVREVSKGWRWGRRPVAPRAAEAHTPPAEPWSFPTDWARSPAGRAARDIVLSGVMKPIVWNETSPDVFGLDNLEGVHPPVMFISNHSSRLDATLILTTLPQVAEQDRDRRGQGLLLRRVVAVGVHGARVRRVPHRAGRRRAGYGQGQGADRGRLEPHRLPRGHALGRRLDAAIPPRRCAPGHRHGHAGRADRHHRSVRRDAEGPVRPKPSSPPIRIRYGGPLRPSEGETHQAFSLRMQSAIAELFDEDRSSWWEARRRAATGATPKLSGPSGPKWRRTWEGSRDITRRGRPPAWR